MSGNNSAGDDAALRGDAGSNWYMEGHVYRVALAFAAPLAALIISLASIAPASAAAMEAYLFRGAGDFSFIGKGLTFSNGMDRLGEKLESAGVPAKVYRWEAVDWAYRDIMKSRPEAVMIMGHSMGALATITLANRLKGSGIRVAYIGTIDIPGPTAITPSNAEVAENYYHAFPVFGQLATPKGHAGTVRNELVWGQVHITMDKSKVVHSAALDFVARSRNAGETMQAYVQEPPANSDVIDQVDATLTASTTSQSAPVENTEAGTDPMLLASLDLPEHIPVPTRAPRGPAAIEAPALPAE
jgi:thioesterase domain-containing protein